MKYIFCLILLLFNVFFVTTVSADEIKIATGHTFIKKVFDPIRSAFKEKSGIDLRIFFNDPVPAMTELEKGNVEVAGASLDFNYWLELSRKANAPIKAADSYNSYIAAYEKTMVVVNSANVTKQLTGEQLKGIFTGKITNWKEVGGDNAPIIVVWPSVSSGALILFKSKILDNEPLTKSVYDVATIADTSDAIAATPEAIGITTGIIGDKEIKQIAPPIERPLTLIYKGKPTANLKKLLDFLKEEGSKYIK